MNSILIPNITDHRFFNLTDIINIQDVLNVNNKLKTNETTFKPWFSLYSRDDFFNLYKELKKEYLEVPSYAKVLTNSNFAKKIQELLIEDDISLKKIYLNSENLERISTNENEILNFNKIIESSIGLIKEISIPLYKIFNKIIYTVILKEKNPESREVLRDRGTGYSSHYFRGAIFLSIPVNRMNIDLDMVLNLVHEIGHQVLMVYQRFDRIIKNDLNKKIYSPVRKIERPMILSFHALIAVYFMLYFIERLVTSKVKLSNNDLSYLDFYRNNLIIEANKII